MLRFWVAVPFLSKGRDRPNSHRGFPMQLYDFEASVKTDDPEKGAVLLETEDGAEHWVPRSVLEMEPPNMDGISECTVPQWWAEDHGLV